MSQTNNSKNSLLLYYPEKICVALPMYWCMVWLTVGARTNETWIFFSDLQSGDRVGVGELSEQAITAQCEGAPQCFLESGMEAGEECIGIIPAEVVGGEERLSRQREQDKQSSPGAGKVWHIEKFET